jgi:hypothetical protein
MKKTLWLMILCFTSFTAGASADEVDIPGYQVYEFDAARFAPNDTKPTLYDVKVVGKADALWIEGSDYNYQWLTIVPYDGIREVNLERVRGNPFVTDTGSWIGRQLAKAGDLRGWFTIVYTDRKGVDRKIILLAPVNQEELLVEVLAEAKQVINVKGELREESEIRTEPVRMIAPPVVPPPAASDVRAPQSKPEVVPQIVRLIDLMTVAEFKTSGLMKLTD